LLHVFLVTFGLFRADNPSKVRLDETGRHAVLVSSKGEQKASDATRDMTNMRENFKLSDLRLLDPVKEYEEATVAMLTLWPNIIIQQQSNTLAMRQLIPKGTDAFELAWTFFGYQDDDEAMITRRLRQANLMGPAGFVSVDDSEVMKLSQDGIRPSPSAAGVLEMGGRDCDDQDHIVTESTIRGFYKYYRQVMGF
jgi:salicylate 5-hydroxylase large subunit